MPRDILFRYLEIGTDRLLHNAACRDPGSGILAGVTIGKRALVAGTVVTRDVASHATVTGCLRGSAVILATRHQVAPSKESGGGGRTAEGT